MRRYTDYKDSEADWLGSIPGTWNVVRAKDLFVERNRPSLTGEETLLTVSHITGVTPRSEKNVNMFMAETMEGYKVCHVGDLIINTMWAWMGALGTSPHHGICSPAYGVYAPRKGVPYCARYFDYLLRTPNAIVEMTRFSKGIVSSRLRLYSDKFYQIALPLPPLPEQQAIADYLDAKTAQIDRKIDLLTQKAAKYRQLKQALINAAVTRGLDQSAPMKDSGVEWIGEVPAHWVLGRLKDFVRVNPTSHLPQNVSDEVLVEFVPMANVDEQLGQIRSFEMVPLQNVASGYKRFQNGDVIFARITPCMENGNCAIVRGLTQCTGFGSTEFQVCRPQKGIIPQYLHYFLHNESFRKNAEPHMKGSAGQKRVPSEYIETHGFALPPLAEQHSIVAYLNERTGTLDRIVAMINAQIDKLADLRKSLINDVVTGKLRVT